MEHDLVLEGRVVTPGGILESEVGVSDGTIAELGHGLRGARKIHAGGRLIFPGFIDIHVHLREPGWEQKEDFRTGSSAAVHGGVTTMVDMPNNPVPTDSPQALGAKAALAKKASIDVRFHGGIRKTDPEAVGRIASGVVGYKLYLSETTGAARFPEELLPRVLGSVAATGKPISIHCEDQQIIDEASLRRRADPRPDSYADARPGDSETSAVRKVIESLKGEPSLVANICHASTRETVALVKGAVAKGMRLSCEAALHHLYYNRAEMLENPLLRTNPPLRGEDDRQALLDAVKGGGVSFLVTDHAPHLEDEKVSQGLAGVPGLDDFSHVVSWLIRAQGVAPARVAEIAAAAPARHLGLADRGEIAPGKRADFAVLDLRASEVVKNESVRSKCGWSPYEEKEFPGRARWVVRGGELLMDDFEQVS
ncbi:MAG: dihydroorotase family protein [Nitrososphaerota archaeon]|nr:dihydroorotase family protein [Nitrososphaerota archaeon]MDG6991281.1 dihydroorotase family protein [Nitrososphaerota archaeon]